MGTPLRSSWHWLAILIASLCISLTSLSEAHAKDAFPAPFDDCSQIFNKPLSEIHNESPATSPSGPNGPINKKILDAEIAARRSRVREFQYIRRDAQQRGLRVWLFGGTAAAYAHYVKWDLLRERGDNRFQPQRFDYDYTNIYRSTQDLDIVVDGSAQDAQVFEHSLKVQFPYFLGSKTAAWEVRSLQEPRTDKGALLDDFGFMNQHTDSNSTGMIELTDPPTGESVVRDIRNWNQTQNVQFLKDLFEGNLTFYYSLNHWHTPRAKEGKNPPIFSVIRALTKAFQYDLKINDKDWAIFQTEVNQFNPARDLANPDAARWIQRNAKKLFQHAVDIEYAWDTLEKLGLRKKLIEIDKNPQIAQTLSWWMNKEPLRRKLVGEGSGRTAQSLGIKIVAHETNDFLAYESITRSHTGAPNVFISRQNTQGESAAFGNGFYTATGKKGARGTGITIRFEVNPQAREGTDFILSEKNSSFSGISDPTAFVIWKNKNAIRVIPESLDLSLLGYFQFLAQGNSIHEEDRALLWKLKRRMDHSIRTDTILLHEMEQVRKIVLSAIKNNSKNSDLLIEEWIRLEGGRLQKNQKELDRLVESFKTKADPISLFFGLRELAKNTEFEKYVAQDWLPYLLNSIQNDVGNRVLEQCIFSEDHLLRDFGFRALIEKTGKKVTPFIQALRGILAKNGDARLWLQSENKNAKTIKQRAAYLALHPELRDALPSSIRSRIESRLAKISNIALFEKMRGGSLPQETRNESFEFKSFHFPPEGKQVQLGDGEIKVTLTRDFQIQLTPVTQLQWALVMGQNPAYFKMNENKTSANLDTMGDIMDFEINPNRPVEWVSWYDIRIFLENLNERDPDYQYRLPTEAEWEYAARADTNTFYSYGNNIEKLASYGWYNRNSNSETHDVASLKPNQNGLYDLHGNVWEWLSDFWADRRPTQSIDPQGPSTGLYRVLRGGSWAMEPHYLQTSVRIYHLPEIRASSFGFRLLRTRKNP